MDTYNTLKEQFSKELMSEFQFEPLTKEINKGISKESEYILSLKHGRRKYISKEHKYFCRALKSASINTTIELLNILFHEEEYKTLLKRLFALRFLTEGKSQRYISKRLKIGIKQVNYLSKKLKNPQNNAYKITALLSSADFRLNYKRWFNLFINS